MPPYFAINLGPASWYFNMILGTYAVLGMFLWKAADKPAANKAFIGFFIWGASFAHMLVMVAAVFADDTPVFDGTESVFGIVMPQRIFGIAHWPNLSPVGDIPLLALFVAGDAYMAKQAFGSYL